MYLQCRFIRKNNRLFVRVTQVARLDKSFGKLRLIRNRLFRGLYEVYPNRLGESKYILFDRKANKVGVLYRSTSHYTWWKLKNE